jgi:hypothetical protein
MNTDVRYSYGDLVQKKNSQYLPTRFRTNKDIMKRSHAKSAQTLRIKALVARLERERKAKLKARGQ